MIPALTISSTLFALEQTAPKAEKMSLFDLAITANTDLMDDWTDNDLRISNSFSVHMDHKYDNVVYLSPPVRLLEWKENKDVKTFKVLDEYFEAFSQLRKMKYNPYWHTLNAITLSENEEVIVEKMNTIVLDSSAKKYFDSYIATLNKTLELGIDKTVSNYKQAALVSAELNNFPVTVAKLKLGVGYFPLPNAAL